jgi:hypothetical protein
MKNYTVNPTETYSCTYCVSFGNDHRW